MTSFLQHRGRILVLRRSSRVGTHQGKWAGVSGYLETPEPLQQALREIQEEAGLTPDDVQLLRRGPPLEVPDPQYQVLWRVHPFLFAVSDPARVRLDWEHTEARWIDPAELGALETVPKLWETWEQVWKSWPDG